MKTCNCWRAAGEAAYIWGYLNSLKKRKELYFLDEEEIQSLQDKLQKIIDIIEDKETE